MTSELFIGLISGTSMDGIDSVLVEFNDTDIKTVATHRHPIPNALRKELNAIIHPHTNEIHQLGSLDIRVGESFANAAKRLLQIANINAKQITAIGSHGQTIRHHPFGKTPYTVQIGDPNTIAAQTGITTVADFRRKDMALGGQGAPLAPAFHHTLAKSHKSNKDRIFLNIGGIANITVIKQDNSPPVGFDTGPGNTLMDNWIQRHQQKPFDHHGKWAKSSKPHQTLLELMLSDPYFNLPIPKSIGREYFDLNWLQKQLVQLKAPTTPPIVQASLLELTAATISKAINHQTNQSADILVCGGGVHNTHLMERLNARLEEHTIQSTDTIGINPDWVEAIAFAWLAKQTIDKKPIDLRHITGANKPAILGGIYYS